MSSPHGATERSPLLGRDHRQPQTNRSSGPISEAEGGVEATDGDFARHNANNADVETHEQHAEDEDPEALRIAKSLRYILPVLGVGVRF